VERLARINTIFCATLVASVIAFIAGPVAKRDRAGLHARNEAQTTELMESVDQHADLFGQRHRHGQFAELQPFMLPRSRRYVDWVSCLARSSCWNLSAWRIASAR